MLEDSHGHCFYPKQKHEHDEKTNLMIAAENGHDEIIKLLLDNGADINAKTKSFDGGSSALIMAAENGHTSTVKFLLENGANPSSKNKRGQTAFHIATERGNKFILEKMFNYDKEIREKSAKSIQKFFRFSIFQNEKRKTLHNEMKYNPKPIRLS